MVKNTLHTRLETVVTHTLELTKEDILAPLRERYEIPPSAQVYVTTPGGGDWSHMPIDIDADNPVVVSWVVRENHEEIKQLPSKGETLINKLRKGEKI